MVINIKLPFTSICVTICTFNDKAWTLVQCLVTPIGYLKFWAIRASQTRYTNIYSNFCAENWTFFTLFPLPKKVTLYKIKILIIRKVWFRFRSIAYIFHYNFIAVFISTKCCEFTVPANAFDWNTYTCFWCFVNIYLPFCFLDMYG